MKAQNCEKKKERKKERIRSKRKKDERIEEDEKHFQSDLKRIPRDPAGDILNSQF
jgi:hypothetical protein